MKNTTVKTTIDVGEIENATELTFAQDPRSDVRYMVTAATWSQLYDRGIAKTLQIKTVSLQNVYIEDTSGGWFAFANVDCFDPPFAIIRAQSFESAYEVFCDEFSRWLAVPDDCAKDYPEDDREYNASGVHIDSSLVNGFELKLLSVSCEAR